jgi:hypothetical protein
VPEIGVMSFMASRTIWVVSKRRRLVTAPDVLVKYEVCWRTSTIRGAENPPTVRSWVLWWWYRRGKSVIMKWKWEKCIAKTLLDHATVFQQDSWH